MAFAHDGGNLLDDVVAPDFFVVADVDADGELGD